MDQQVINLVGAIFANLAHTSSGQQVINDLVLVIGRMYQGLIDQGIPPEQAAVIVSGFAKTK